VKYFIVHLWFWLSWHYLLSDWLEIKDSSEEA